MLKVLKRLPRTNSMADLDMQPGHEQEAIVTRAALDAGVARCAAFTLPSTTHTEPL
jgi:hypothetical protein